MLTIKVDISDLTVDVFNRFCSCDPVAFFQVVKNAQALGFTESDLRAISVVPTPLGQQQQGGVSE
jgi:hypothetical protein